MMPPFQTVAAPLEGLILHKVSSAPDVDSLKSKLYSLCNADRKCPFPAPLPVSLERSQFDNIKNNKYVVCEKTDGQRCLLLCTKLNGVDVCLLVTRSLDFYCVPIEHVPTALFQDTVLDGELVFASGTWHFLIFDAMAVSGIFVGTKPLSARLAATRVGMTTYVHDASDPIVLVIKNFYCTIEEFDKRLEKGYFLVDGVILTPESMPVVCGRHWHLFKLKTHHTIDFRMDAGLKLAIFDGSRHVVVSRLNKVVGTKLSRGDIVEAEYAGNDRWTFVKHRIDKKHCNDMLTYTKTILNIEENIQESELAMLLQ